MKRLKICFIFTLIVISLGFISFNAKRKYLSSNDILAVYVNKEYVDKMPSKDDVVFSKAVCDDDVDYYWDVDNWGLLISNFSKKVKCNLYFVTYSEKTTFNFDYTGDEQTFTAPVSGTYKLETWGAQGGDWDSLEGGNGGYSVGNIKLLINDSVFITVGKIAENKKSTGTAPGGGGASYILMDSGKLSEFENNLNKILIVAGGGGGTEWTNGYGGSGGGYIGNSGNVGYLKNDKLDWTSVSPPASGGNQQNGGKSTTIDSRSGTANIYDGTFGVGGYTSGGSSGSGGGQGGIGYYGGGASDFAGGGGGGSGYIGNSLLKNKVMYCYNCEESSEESTKTVSTTCANETPTSYCAKKGNGYARITLVSIDE